MVICGHKLSFGLRLDLVRYPGNGAWPAEMRRDMAAAYVDEPSAKSFVRKVRLGVYPRPAQSRGMVAKWSRAGLEAAVTARHSPTTNRSLADEIL